MCRHLAWLGPPLTLEQLVLAPPFGLLRQSYQPRRQRHGLLNADGFGVGWYAPSRPQPARYRRAVPLWTDPSFSSFAGVVSSGCVLAAVRSATTGMPVEETATAPFARDRWLLSHNGRVDRDAVWPLLAAGTVPESSCDSAVLAALLWQLLPAGPAPEALTRLVSLVAGVDPQARLNLLATDGESILATCWGDTLGYRHQDGGVLVGSEPPDDEPGWTAVPDRGLLVAGRDGVEVTSLT